MDYAVVWALLATIWAITTTLLLWRNPLPFPDRGHRVFGVRSEAAREAVVEAIESSGPLRQRFTFDSGPTHQTVLWDGFTSINHVEEAFLNGVQAPGTGLSMPVADPRAAAERAAVVLRQRGFEAQVVGDVPGVPQNHLVLLKSKAMDGWLLVFRRKLIHMPRPTIRKPARP